MKFLVWYLGLVFHLYALAWARVAAPGWVVFWISSLAVWVASGGVAVIVFGAKLAGYRAKELLKDLPTPRAGQREVSK